MTPIFLNFALLSGEKMTSYLENRTNIVLQQN